MATKSILSDEIELNPVTAASIPNPASGDFAVFLNSSNGNKLSKKSSAGVVTDMETTVADNVFISGTGIATEPLTLKLPYKLSNILLRASEWYLSSGFYYNDISYDVSKVNIIFLTPFYGGDDYSGTLQFHTCNICLYKIDEANDKLIFAATSAPDRDVYVNVLDFYQN